MPTTLESSVALLDARRVNGELRRAKELREAYGINFYRPHWKQHRFHEMGSVTGRYCRFGNRTGKTVCGSAEDVAWLYGGRMWYRSSFDVKDGEGAVRHHHEGRKDHSLVTEGIPRHSVKGLLVVSSWKKAKEIFTNRTTDWSTCGELFQLLPKSSVIDTHSTQGNLDMIYVQRPEEFGGGVSTLEINTVESYKHSNLSAESSDYDFVHYDEPPPHDMFIANKRGLTDRNGKFWINATPVSELWVNDEFCPPHATNVKVAPEGVHFRKSEKGGERFIITASIFDNPYISQEGRDEFESSLTEEEKLCRLYGLPLNLAGLIYKEFIYDDHVLSTVPRGWNDYHLPPLDYTVRVAWDVHDAIPQAILLIATAPTGESFIYDEMFFSRTISENAELLREKVKDRFVADYLIDPRAVIESPVTSTSILDELMNWDFYFDMGSKDMNLGISKTREKLKERRSDGKPTLYVAPTCVRFIFEIMRYAYNPKTMRPVDKDDHLVEDLRRLVLTGLDYVAAPTDRDYVRRDMNVGFNELAVPARR